MIFYRIVNWLTILSVLYVLMSFSLVNLSPECFIFFIGVIYISVLISYLGPYRTMLYTIKYHIYIKTYYEQVFIYSNFVKKLNIKTCIIYRYFH